MLIMGERHQAGLSCDCVLDLNPSRAARRCRVSRSNISLDNRGFHDRVPRDVSRAASDKLNVLAIRSHFQLNEAMKRELSAISLHPTPCRTRFDQGRPSLKTSRSHRLRRRGCLARVAFGLQHRRRPRACASSRCRRSPGVRSRFQEASFRAFFASMFDHRSKVLCTLASRCLCGHQEWSESAAWSSCPLSRGMVDVAIVVAISSAIHDARPDAYGGVLQSSHLGSHPRN